MTWPQSCSSLCWHLCPSLWPVFRATFSLHLVHEDLELSEYESVPEMWREPHFPMTSHGEAGKVLLGCRGNPWELGTKSDVGRFRMESSQHLLWAALKSEPQRLLRVPLTCSRPLSLQMRWHWVPGFVLEALRSQGHRLPSCGKWKLGSEKESQHLNLKRKAIY